MPNPPPTTVTLPAGARPFPRSLWILFLIASLLWLGCHTVITARFRLPDSDSVMYGLPLAFAHSPFDLKTPLIGNFPPYSNAWGHHWFGAMVLRAGVFSVVPFSQPLDFVLLLGALWGAAAITGALVWRFTGNLVLTGSAALVVLSEPQLIRNISLERFEPVGVLVFVAALAWVLVADGKEHWGWQLLGLTGFFLCPSLHPYSLVLGGGTLCIFLGKAFLFRSCPSRSAVLALIAFVAGGLAFAAWYALQPAALEQLLVNLRTQGGFFRSFNTVLTALSPAVYRLGSGYLLWGLATFSCALILSGRRHPSARHLEDPALRYGLPLLFLGLIAFHTVTRCSNAAYLTFGTPTAVMLVCFGAVRLGGFSRAGGLLGSTAVLLVALLFSVILPYRILAFAKAGFPDLSNRVASIIAALPEGHRVYIPPPVWPAAARDTKHEYRLWTFAVASDWDVRLRYEKQVYAEAKPGDILIVDRLIGRTGDPYGILPTFETRPPDPAYWEPVSESVARFPGKSNDFGFDFAVFRFKGGRWDPASSPRNMPGR